MGETSTSLLERVRQRDDVEAWNRFLDLYAPLIHAWAVRARLQPADAADLLQEVLATLVRQLPTFQYDPERSFRAWLKTVTLNCWRARARRARTAPLDGQVDPAVDDPAVEFWESEYRGWLTARALKIMQAEIEPRTWRACWLTAAEGRPAANAAAELGMTVGAVYAARCRVLARLRRELDGLGD
jgi:RNA polymerase sigma-70 factor (ECF subfamily)